jgi:glycosyltransferase involved in cell wall biosynthesis
MEPIRVAILCDYVEEKWPSMDIVAEMIHVHLEHDAGTRVVSTLFIPPFKKRLGRLPLIGSRKLATNSDRLINRYLDYPRMVRRLVREGSFDLYHIVDHSYSQLVHALPVGRTVVSCHDLDTFRCLLEPSVEPRPAWFRALTRRTLNGLARAGAVVCSSEATRSEIIRRGLVAEAKLLTNHLGTHPECHAAPTPEVVAQVEALLGSPDAIEVLHVGSNIPRKRIDVLLKTFAGIREIWPQARLIKVGGPFTPEQSKLATHLGIQTAITVLPFIENRAVLAAIYRRSTVLLQTSEAEGFGMPLAEAIACDTPIVASDIPVLREIAGDQAVYCPVGDVQAWIETASSTIRDIRGQTEMINAAKLRNKRMYRWDGHVGVLAELYGSLLAEVPLEATNIAAKLE